jgi:hypothetical protein
MVNDLYQKREPLTLSLESLRVEIGPSPRGGVFHHPDAKVPASQSIIPDKTGGVMIQTDTLTHSNTRVSLAQLPPRVVPLATEGGEA